MTGSCCWPAGTGWQPGAPVAGGRRTVELPAAGRGRTAGVPRVSVFPAPFTLEAAEAVAGRRRARRCCGWWTARCWSRRVLARMAAPGTGCWRRCAATGPGCWPGRGGGPGAAAPWPGTRCGWPKKPPRGCRPDPGKWPRPSGWMPRMPPCARCWPGRWTMTRIRRCGWQARWAGGGPARPAGPAVAAAARRPARHAEPGSDGWCAAQLARLDRCSRPISRGSWTAPPRPATPCGAGSRPACLSNAWPASR